jgi:hypothetical protein
VTIPKAEIRAALAKLDPFLAKANMATPPFEWREKAGGFAGLVRLILNSRILSHQPMPSGKDWKRAWGRLSPSESSPAIPIN